MSGPKGAGLPLAQLPAENVSGPERASVVGPVKLAAKTAPTHREATFHAAVVRIAVGIITEFAWVQHTIATVGGSAARCGDGNEEQNERDDVASAHVDLESEESARMQLAESDVPAREGIGIRDRVSGSCSGVDLTHRASAAPSPAHFHGQGW